MNMLMTFYACPLIDKIPISQALNAFLDNPRTPDEIASVRDYIERSYDKDTAFNFPPYSDQDIVTLELFVNHFRNQFSSKDYYIKEFCQSYSRENIYDFIARMWIVARYDDEGEHESLRDRTDQLREEGASNFFFLLEDHNPIIENSKKLADYSYLMSLFIHTQPQDYYGASFILDVDSHQFSGSNNASEFLPLAFLNFGMASRECETTQDELRWHFLPCVESDIRAIADKLDNAFAAGLKDKLLYVASLLKIVSHDIADVKMKLVVLVSIIELLLTHNPDFNRFNVEDSISKQFRLKASLLIYLHDKSQDIYEIKNRLKIIYDLRSKIAHGNFKGVEKYIAAHSRGEEEENSIDSLVTTLYAYIRAILTEYLADPSLVDFLKEN